MSGVVYLILVFTVEAVRTQPVIIDHHCTDITLIPQSAIEQARATLHIAYGHTSHGSQIVSGMTGLVDFANGGGKGLTLPVDIFAWNEGGTDGALDLDDYAMADDVGTYPAWYDNTVNYLENPNSDDVNVIMWAWCGQVNDKYYNNQLFSEYLTPMTQLEDAYPNVTFVYMTGHVDHNNDAINKAANSVVRDYCRANNKVLYDFADIETFDPDGVYYPFPDDDCEYYASRTGALLGNWATEWQDAHVEGVDWYDIDASHTVALNGNQKAYAAWWMFARLAGWEGTDKTDGVSIPGDIDGSGKVDMADFAIIADPMHALMLIAENWLEGVED